MNYGYQHCIDDIDLDWIGHATDEEITNCFNDLVKVGIISTDLKDVTNSELQRFWLIYWLEYENIPYPYHIKDVNSYNHYCWERSKHYAQPVDNEDDTTPF